MSVSRAALRSYPKLGGLKPQEFTTSQLWGREIHTRGSRRPGRTWRRIRRGLGASRGSWPTGCFLAQSCTLPPLLSRLALFPGVPHSSLRYGHRPRRVRLGGRDYIGTTPFPKKSRHRSRQDVALSAREAPRSRRPVPGKAATPAGRALLPRGAARKGWLLWRKAMPPVTTTGNTAPFHARYTVS